VNEVDAAASDYGFATIAEAARHIRDAADYIVAVENGLPRQ
jgi:hypothetical protein